jgi:uncharacterized protein (DUF1697 family)
MDSPKNIFIALLRGVNVGGNGKVSMAQLKNCLEEMGFTNVRTYINSGNIIFVSDESDTVKLALKIEHRLHETFKFPISVVVKSLAEMQALAGSIPKAWHAGKEFRYYVMFLRPSIDNPHALEELKINPEMEEVIYVPGALLWSAEIAKIGHSKVQRVIFGTKLYKEMTMRNLNTTLKVYDLMKQAAI